MSVVINKKRLAEIIAESIKEVQFSSYGMIATTACIGTFEEVQIHLTVTCDEHDLIESPQEKDLCIEVKP